MIGMGGRSARTGFVSSSFELSDLERRLTNLIRLGKVEEADYQTARLRVRIGLLLTGWLPWITNRAGQDRSWWAPEVGEQVVVLASCGDLSQGVVLAGIFQTAHPAPADRETVHQVIYQDGAEFEYDRQAHRWRIKVPGDVELTATGNLTIRVDGNIEMIAQGHVRIQGARIDLN